MLDTDIEGLSPKDAAEYVLSFITTLKATEKQLAAIGEEVALWTRRVALAREKGKPDLTGQAQAKLAGLEAKRSGLETELADLRAKVVILTEKLKRLRARPEKLVDTDLLLAQLEMLVGRRDTLAEAMKREEAGAKLDELKRKAGKGAGGSAEGGGPAATAESSTANGKFAPEDASESRLRPPDRRG